MRESGGTEKVFGENNVLGHMAEDECVVGQLRLLLKRRFGLGNYTCMSLSTSEILSLDQSDGTFILVHGCLERVAHPPTEAHGKYMQAVHVIPQHICKRWDAEYMHTILVLPRCDCFCRQAFRAHDYLQALVASVLPCTILFSSLLLSSLSTSQ